MLSKIILFISLVIIFFALAIVQNSYLPYFSFFGAVPNIVFCLFFVLIFFEKKSEYRWGFVIALVAGFFLDVFLPSYFGISILSLLAVYFLEKGCVQILKQGQDAYPVWYFLPLFIVSFIVYQLIFFLLSRLFHASLHIDIGILIATAYNTFFGFIGFYLYKTLIYSEEATNQLKLF